MKLLNLFEILLSLNKVVIRVELNSYYLAQFTRIRTFLSSIKPNQVLLVSRTAFSLLTCPLASFGGRINKMKPLV